MDTLVDVNTLAEGSPGFVWRLQPQAGDATGIQAFDDELVVVNMSVWASIEALADYVYRTVRTDFLRRRAQSGSSDWALRTQRCGGCRPVRCRRWRTGPGGSTCSRQGPTSRVRSRSRTASDPAEVATGTDVRDTCPA